MSLNSKKHLGHTARKRFGQNFLHDQKCDPQHCSGDKSPKRSIFT